MVPSLALRAVSDLHVTYAQSRELVEQIRPGHRRDWPLIRELTRMLRHQEFALWCGTTRTADWHPRFDVAEVVYEHLRIPRRATYDSVRLEEVSIGYPAEWQRIGLRGGLARQILAACP